MGTGIRILLFGASGRMGSEVVDAVERSKSLGEDLEVVGGIVSRESSLIGHTLSGITFPLSTEWEENYSAANIMIDFSSPNGADAALKIALEKRLPILIGSTALTAQQEENIKRSSTEIPIVRATNTSVGVNVVFQLVAEAAQMLGKDFEVELVETHHHHKKDSPSGTARSLVERICQTKDVERPIVFGRSGDRLTRNPSEIGVHSLRGGDVVGEHRVYFLGLGETVEITHRATRRAIYADGALRAAKWLIKKKQPGYYQMVDVLKGE